jgi:pyruvate formate lyase activating enzyme
MVSERPPAGPAAAGTVLNIQRMSTEDGPGIRTTVFFKGCSLACSWCHNPESIEARPRVVWNGERCIGCRDALAVCPSGALSDTGDGIRVDPAQCRRCGACVEECPSGALERLGERWSLDDLVAEVAKDRAWFDRSGGGVTASGGEPAAQAGFVAPFLRRCHERGLHTVLDTCGMAATERLREVVEAADMVLYDLKIADDDGHRQHTGQSNERVLDNLVALADLLGPGRRELWLRTPLIPDVTATADNRRALAEFVARHLPGAVARWELCAFNNLCEHKYERLGQPWAFAGQPLLRREQLDRLAEVVRLGGVDPDIVHVTGAARLEETSP